HRRQSSSTKDDAKPGSHLPHGWTHHPRQPGPHSDSYFPGTASQPPRTPVSAMRGHSRNVSSSGAHPMASSMTANGVGIGMDFAAPQSAHGGFGGGGGPPSPSTLTDVILGLHKTLYTGKRSPEEVREMVWSFYESGAVFESPLLSAHGREQIANQFIMAFALPGMDVHSELRDVICSDFEFDGTRAGIIDQTITVTFLPSLFGSSARNDAPESSTDSPRQSRPGNASASGFHPAMSAIPITPHPFADYPHGSMSAFSRMSRPHSPTTPFSISSLWGSRPHTPGHTGGGSAIRPLSTSTLASYGFGQAPPSVNGDDTNDPHSMLSAAGTSQFVDTEASGGGQMTRPPMPQEALQPHWSAEGLGRQTFRALLWSLFHPRQALKSLCSIQLRVLSRLEFNDAGLIVRHEDTWGLRETIEGVIPFASLIYAIERRVVGFFVSWAIGKGFRLSNALLRKAISGPSSTGTNTPYLYQRQNGDPDAQDAAMALLERSGSHFTRPSFRDFNTISRSRAPSPSRFRFGSMSGQSVGTVTGTRSRARSLVGQQPMTPFQRTMSTDSLHQHFGSCGGNNDSTPRRSCELPPDSGAKYRDRTAKRLEGGRTSSTVSAPPTTCDVNDVGGGTTASQVGSGAGG
ncbi:hypothetical protein IE53DRAFT_308200, partial [Violaceomyces palustris]